MDQLVKGSDGILTKPLSTQVFREAKKNPQFLEATLGACQVATFFLEIHWGVQMEKWKPFPLRSIKKSANHAP